MTTRYVAPTAPMFGTSLRCSVGTRNFRQWRGASPSGKCHASLSVVWSSPLRRGQSHYQARVRHGTMASALTLTLVLLTAVVLASGVDGRSISGTSNNRSLTARRSSLFLRLRRRIVRFIQLWRSIRRRLRNAKKAKSSWTTINGRKVKLTGYQVLKIYAATNKIVKLLANFVGISGEYGLFLFCFISV